MKKILKVVIVVLFLTMIVGCGSKEKLKGKNLENKNLCLANSKKAYNSYISKNSGVIVNDIGCSIGKEQDIEVYVNATKNGEKIIEEYNMEDDKFETNNLSESDYDIVKIDYNELLYALDHDTLKDGDMINFIFTPDELR